MKGKASTEEEVLKATEQVGELQMTCQETKVLLTKKSKEALGLSTRNAELHAEVERLRGELAQREEELVQKDASLKKTKEELTKDAANSYMTGFDDVVAQVTCVYPELDLSNIGLGKVVVDGQLVDEE